MDNNDKADDRYATLSVELDGRLLKGHVVYLSYDSVAIRQTHPRRGGCIRTKIYPPFSAGFLVDDDGCMNEHGTQVAARTLVELDRAAREMVRNMDAMVAAVQEVLAADPNLSPAQQAVRVHEVLGGDSLAIDLPHFASTLEEWIREGEFGLDSPPPLR
jgi:hypothetical protein